MNFDKYTKAELIELLKDEVKKDEDREQKTKTKEEMQFGFTREELWDCSDKFKKEHDGMDEKEWHRYQQRIKSRKFIEDEKGLVLVDRRKIGEGERL